MTRPNTPPSSADLARLIDRVDKLERLFTPRGPNVLGELEDVDADYPEDGQAPIYDETSGKYRLGTPSSGLPIVDDDGTNTVSILHNSSHRLILQSVRDSDSRLLSRIIFDSDGTFYIDAKLGEAVISVPQNAEFMGLSGNHTYVWAEEFAGGAGEAFLAVFGLSAGVDNSTWSKATFYTLGGVGGAQNIWDGMLAAPVTGDLSASQFGFWFDDTNGAASINFKGKTADGTVVTWLAAMT